MDKSTDKKLNSLLTITKIYEILLEKYGPQGWWPLMGLNNNQNINFSKSGSIKGYHPNDYSYPKTEDEKFEICMGCFLTQNTSWESVEKALLNLKRINALTLKGFKKISDGKFRECIKVSGYYNQKSKYIKEFIPFFESLEGKTPSRQELLNQKGIGPETADSMLLYAFKQPEFIVDSYTKRILVNLNIITWKHSYNEIKILIEDNFNQEDSNKVQTYQEFHALLVEHAKRYYSKEPYGKDCFLKKILE